ncbi:MAG TPA: hypothetical protein VK745_12565 [Polyangiaceae bacterium]|jgi:hypothetical protein|nr:hypothetical protein [Polyangiaceae bacterium]
MPRTSVVLLESQIEEAVRSAVSRTLAGSFLTLAPTAARRIEAPGTVSSPDRVEAPDCVEARTASKPPDCAKRVDPGR